MAINFAFKTILLDKMLLPVKREEHQFKMVFISFEMNIDLQVESRILIRKHGLLSNKFIQNFFQQHTSSHHTF